MAKFVESTFENVDVELDNNEYDKCLFISCRIIYSGGSPPTLTSCEFRSPRFTFSGSAANTLNFMKSMYRGGLNVMIEDTIKKIKE